MLVGLQSVSPPEARTVRVWTASRSLPGGTVLRPADLTTTRLAPESVPDEAISDPSEVVGRTLAAPLTRGQSVTDLDTVSPGLLGGYPGRTVVPLRVADAAVVELLRVGDRVSVIVADPEGREPPQVVATDVPVIAIPRADDDRFAAGTPGRLVLVAVPTPDSVAMARWSMAGYVAVIWGR